MLLLIANSRWLVFLITMSYVIKSRGKVINQEISAEIWETTYNRFLTLTLQLESNLDGNQSAAYFAGLGHGSESSRIGCVEKNRRNAA